MRGVVRVCHGLGEIEDLTGTVVILDVFRASNTILALLASGVPEVVLASTLEQARALRLAHPDWPLLGERGGVAPDDFDGNNSPTAAPRVAAGRPAAILTTSAGTRPLPRLVRAERIAYASFGNATALVHAVRAGGWWPVTLLPVGLEAREPASEDDLAAAYLEELLRGGRPVFDPVRERLQACAGADRLRRLGQGDDLELCTRLDVFDLVPEVRRGEPPSAAVSVPSSRC